MISKTEYRDKILKLVKPDWKGLTLTKKERKHSERILFTITRPRGVYFSAQFVIDIMRSLMSRRGRKYLDLGCLFL